MRLSCEKCGARSREFPETSYIEWKCPLCMRVQIFQEKFFDDVVEFTQEFELGENDAEIN